MSTSLLYHAFGIIGYHYRSQQFHGGKVTFHIEQPRERLCCPQCGCQDVWIRDHAERTFRTVPIGAKPTFVTLDVARVWCPVCDVVRQVKIGFADPKMYQRTQAKVPAEIGRYDHIALKVDDPTYDALKARLDAAGENFRETNHGYCKSIYTNSPDGLIVEFTCDPPDVAEIDALRRTANCGAGSAATATSTTSCATAISERGDF